MTVLTASVMGDVPLDLWQDSLALAFYREQMLSSRLRDFAREHDTTLAGTPAERHAYAVLTGEGDEACMVTVSEEEALRAASRRDVTTGRFKHPEAVFVQIIMQCSTHAVG